MTHDTVIVTVTFCEILEEWYYTASITHVDLKANTWSIRIGLNSSSTDPGDLVYKIDSLVQGSLLSFLVLTPIQDFWVATLELNSFSWDYPTQDPLTLLFSHYPQPKNNTVL